MAAPNELSFLPEDYLDRKRRRRTNAICAALFAVVMVACGSAFLITERNLRAAEKRHDDVERQYAEAARRIQQVQQMQEKQRTMAQQAELTAALLEKAPRSFILAELTNALPPGVSLLDFGMESKRQSSGQAPAGRTVFEQRKAAMEARQNGAAVPAAGPVKFDISMKLTGIASTDVQVAQYMGKLGRSDLLDEVNLLVTEEFKHGDEKLRKFQIEMILNPRASVESRRAGSGGRATAGVELQEK